MPQMAPMSWVMLFTFFTISLIMVMTINYYLYLPKMEGKTSKEMSNSKSLNWKW